MSFVLYGLTAYELVLAFWKVVIAIFFREIRPRGAFNIPRDGPVLFVAAPHHNQFLDPLLIASEVYRETGRKTANIIAAKSLTRKFVGAAARAFESIGVGRAADLAFAGTGKIYVDEHDPLVVRGVGTRFNKQLAPMATVQFGKALEYASALVDQVVSDTEVRLKAELAIKDSTSAQSATDKVREATAQSGNQSFKVLPHVDQQEMYGKVYRHLSDGKCLCIFPEGGSHDRTDLLPLKAGVTIMALGAMASNPDLRVKIVPVGLSYFHAHKFRSRAVVEFGAPLDIPPELVTQFSQGGKDKRAACGKLLDVIYEGLKTVTLRTPDFETLMVIQAARRLYKSPGQSLTLGQIVELNRRFIEGYLHYQHEPRVQALRENIIRYNRSLRNLGLRDHQVERATRAGWRTLALLAYRVGLLLAWSVFALPGSILHAPIFITAKVISHKKAKEALAASTVKIAARDVLSTWKVLVSLGLTPSIYVLYTLIGEYLAWRWALPTAVRWWIPAYVFVGFPFLAVAALKFGEAAMDVMKSLPPLFINLIPGNEKQLQQIKETREALSEELSGVINHFGPELFEDFHDNRIQPASKSVSSSAAKRSRADGENIFSHPMRWVDERVFGWSGRDKRRYASSSGATSPAADSGAETDETDDDADYDQVINILHRHSGAGLADPGSPVRKTRPVNARGQSYADLQSLKRSESGKALDGLTSPLARADDLPPAADEQTPLLKLRKNSGRADE